MTDETKKLLPGIIKRIDELRDEVAKIHKEEFKEFQMRRDALNEVGRIFAARGVRRLHEVYASIDDAANILENF